MISNTPNKVSLAPGDGYYRQLQNQKEPASFAIAELIDNSIQSFKDHEEELKAFDPTYQLQVDIFVKFVDEEKSEVERIVVEDNAYGFEETRFEHSFEFGSVDDTRKGLNEHGFGMKNALFMLSEKWKVSTVQFGTGIEHQVCCTLDDIEASLDKTLPVLNMSVSPTKHGTTITMENLTKKISKRNIFANYLDKKQKKKIAAKSPIERVKADLQDIYRKQITTLYGNDTPIMKIIFHEMLSSGEVQDSILTFTPYEPLTAPACGDLKSPDHKKWFVGNDKKWIVKFKDIGYYDEVEHKSYKASGFLGILDKGNSDHNGLVIFREGRAILGARAGERHEHLKLTSLDRSSFQYKYIYGEIEVDGFDTTYTKDDVSDNESLAFLLFKVYEHLQEQIDLGKEIDIFSQVDKFRKKQYTEYLEAINKQPEPQRPEPQKPEPQKPEPQRPEPQKPEPQKPEPQKPEPPLVPIDDVPGVKDKPKTAKQFISEVKGESFSCNNTDYMMKMGYYEQEDALPFSVKFDRKDDQLLTCEINLGHPFFANLKNTGYKTYIPLIKALAITKFQMEIENEDYEDMLYSFISQFNKQLRLVKSFNPDN